MIVRCADRMRHRNDGAPPGRIPSESGALGPGAVIPDGMLPDLRMGLVVHSGASGASGRAARLSARTKRGILQSETGPDGRSRSRIVNQDEVYSAIEQLRRRGERGVLATVTEIRGSSPAGLGSKMLIVEGRGRAFGTVGGGCVDGQVWTAAPRVLERGLPETLEIDLTDHDDDPDHGLICGGIVSVFLEPLQSERLVICGAGHIGEALAAFAGRLGYHITVIDDRASFASPERFADSVELRVGAFEDQLATLELNAACSAVIVTRGHRYDEACLRALVDQPLRYLGLIGSRSKISKLFARLAKDGVDPNQLAAVRAPIRQARGNRLISSTSSLSPRVRCLAPAQTPRPRSIDEKTK